MSSSSPPDGPESAPLLDLADIEEDELEVEHEHERALGEQRGAQRERGRSWVTLAWAIPGFVWLRNWQRTRLPAPENSLDEIFPR